MGLMGDGLWGNPPEATVGALSTGANSSEHPYVYIDQWTEHDPKVLWTKASGLFMPVLFDPSSLWIATVKEQSGGTEERSGETEEQAAAQTKARAR